MTNLAIQATNAVASVSASTPGMLSKYGSQILISVLTATILGVGAIFWRYFGHPALTRWIKRRAERRRRDDLVASFNELECSGGTDCIRNKHFVAIKLPNNTSKPVIVRSVRLVRDGRPIYGMWHDPKYDHPSGDRTELVQTGVKIAPRNHGTWFYTGPEFTSEECPPVRQCQIEFEYSVDDQDMHEHSMLSPEEKGDSIFFMFDMWWKAVGRDIRERKKTQPET